MAATVPERTSSYPQITQITPILSRVVETFRGGQWFEKVEEFNQMSLAFLQRRTG